jgi:hypothetical protein
MRSGVAAGCTRCATCVCALAWSSVALAADPKLQTVAETSVGYTDNVASVPNRATPGVPAKTAGAFALLSPGLVLVLSTPRAQHRFGYTYTYFLFLEGVAPNSSANRGSYEGFFDLSPSSALVLNSNIVQSKADPTNTLGTDPSLVPGTISYLAGTVDELLTVDLDSQWRAWQGANALYQTALSGGTYPQTASVGGRTGIERKWQTDALGVEARADYVVITQSVLPDGTPAGTQRQLADTGVLQWRHDLSAHFSDRLEAGVFRVDRLNTRRGFWSPTGAAALTYTNDRGEAELSYAHALTTIPFLGQFLLVDEVRLRGAVPITPNRELLFVTSAAYQRGRLLDQDETLVAHVDTLLADVGLAWQVADPLLLGLRYQYVQRWSDVSLPPLPLSFARNTVTLSATIQLPPQNEMPKRYRAPRRVDRTDEIRDSDAPAEK